MSNRFHPNDSEKEMIDKIANDGLDACLKKLSEQMRVNGYMDMCFIHRAAVDQVLCAEFSANMIIDIYRKGDDKSTEHLTALVEAVINNIVIMVKDNYKEVCGYQEIH